MTMNLHLLTDDHDTFAAADLDDLAAAWSEHHGGDFTTHNADEGIEWERIPDDRELTIWCNADGVPDEPHADGNAKVTKTAREWAAQQSKRGMLCSTEY
jgi:hypothetical protein